MPCRYAELCLKLSRVQMESLREISRYFKKCLLKRCQTDFEKSLAVRMQEVEDLGLPPVRLSSTSLMDGCLTC